MYTCTGCIILHIDDNVLHVSMSFVNLMLPNNWFSRPFHDIIHTVIHPSPKGLISLPPAVNYAVYRLPVLTICPTYFNFIRWITEYRLRFPVGLSSPTIKASVRCSVQLKCIILLESVKSKAAALFRSAIVAVQASSFS